MADEGITGTSAKKRKDFQRLLADCRKGRIDKVLVKSISRFARNTTECLETIRELKSLGISIYFEEHNIDTKMVSSEMLTAVISACAQAESESISKNMRWSYQKRMSNGTYTPSSVAYGYRLIDKQIMIQPDEAVVVSQIFTLYLSGYSKWKMNMMQATGQSMMIGGALLLTIGLMMGTNSSWCVNVKGMIVLIALITISAVCFAIYNELLAYHPISKIAIFNALIPVLGVIFSAVLLKEELKWQYFIAVMMVACGIYLVNCKCQ